MDEAQVEPLLKTFKVFAYSRPRLLYIVFGRVLNLNKTIKFQLRGSLFY